jgi:hypothetical protein
MVSRSRSAAVSARLLLTLITIPVCLGAADVHGAELTASWIDNSNGTAATRLERRPVDVSAFIAIVDVPAGVTEYVDTSVNAGTTYCYRALAHDPSGVSPYSDEACASPPLTPLTLVFTNPASGATVSGTATVSLSASGGSGYAFAVKADGTTIYGGSNGSFSWNTGAVNDGSHTLTATVTDAQHRAATAAQTVMVSNSASPPLSAFINALFAAGITSGCATNPPQFCPALDVTRGEMAVFLVRGIHGAGFDPPAATGTVFTDVPASDPFAKWIEQLAADGITGGCGPTTYCPDETVMRGQMAVFLLRAKHGAGFDPPPATGTVFTDVPASHPFAKWIEQLALEGITGGCGPTTYCPDETVTRAEMAVFLVRAFNLPM